MKLIVVGDKSRYQFLRKITNAEFFDVDFFTNDIVVNACVENYGENVVYCKSNCLPLNTEVFFPSESKTSDFKRIASTGFDKVIVLDEFPFITDAETKILDSVMKENDFLSLDVVVFVNERKGLDNDISDMDSAIEDAINRYSSKSISATVHQFGSVADFLFFKNNDFLKNPIVGFKNKINRIRNEIETNFELDYEIEFMYRMEAIAGSFDFPVKWLDSFCKYSGTLKGKNIFDEFQKQALNFCWAEKREFMDFVDNIYGKHVNDICVWDLNKDLAVLHSGVVYEFQNKTKSKWEIVFDASEYEYEKFKNKHQNKINHFKNSVKDFFEAGLRDYLKKYIMERLKKLEDLICEKTENLT